MKPADNVSTPVRLSYRLASSHLERAFLEEGKALPRVVRYDLDPAEVAALPQPLRRMMLLAGFVRFPTNAGDPLQIRLNELPEAVYSHPALTLERLVRAALCLKAQELADALPSPADRGKGRRKPPKEAALLPRFIEHALRCEAGGDPRSLLIEWSYAYKEVGGGGPWVELAGAILAAAGLVEPVPSE